MAFLEKSHPLWQTISSIAEDEGFSLYDAELLTPGSLRLSIASSKQGRENGTEDAGATQNSVLSSGVTSGDCSRVLRRLMVVFQAEGKTLGVSTEPEIDVSSPGLNRLLRLPEHFERALGERVKLVLRPSRELEAAAGKKISTLVGRLERYSAGRLSVLDEANQEKFEVPLEDIKRANVVFVFS